MGNLLRPGTAELLDYGGGDLSVVLAAGTATGDAFSVVEHRLAAGAQGPPLHRHEQRDAFYVLEGSLTLRIGDETVVAEPGTFACFSPGVAHTFLNPSEAPVRVLNINAPGGWDRVLRVPGHSGDQGRGRVDDATEYGARGTRLPGVGELRALRDRLPRRTPAHAGLSTCSRWRPVSCPARAAATPDVLEGLVGPDGALRTCVRRCVLERIAARAFVDLSVDAVSPRRCATATRW